MVNFSELKGKTFHTITVDRRYEDRIIFEGDEGSYKMMHYQDCCENVWLDEHEGLERLQGQEIIEAYESSKIEESQWGDEDGWFFYTLRTNLDTATIVWRGSSNGYYSIEAHLYKLN